MPSILLLLLVEFFNQLYFSLHFTDRYCQHFQVPFAEAVRKEAGIPTGAVGLITEPKEAEKVLQDGQADYILIAREFLRDSGWVLRAAKELGLEVKWPGQYERADQERWAKKRAAEKQ